MFKSKFVALSILFISVWQLALADVPHGETVAEHPTARDFSTRSERTPAGTGAERI